MTRQGQSQPPPPQVGFLETYHQDRTDLVESIHQEYTRLGISFAVYTASGETTLACQRAGIAVYDIGWLGDASPGPVESPEWPLKISGYDFESLDMFVDPERRYFRYPRWLDSRLVARAQRCLENARRMSEITPLPTKYMVTQQGAEILRLAVAYSLDREGVPLIYLGAFPPQLRSRMLLSLDLMNSILPRRSKPSAGVVDEACRELWTDPEGVALYSHGRRRESRTRRLLDLIRRGDYERLLWPLFGLWHLLSEVPRRRAALDRHSVSLKDCRFSDKNVLIPLHTDNDSQLTVRNRQYLDQSQFVSFVRDATPSCVQLVVKPHPHEMGLLPVNEIERIAQLPNTCLLDRSIPATEVLPHVSCVAIINSSVGLDALIQGKRVLVVGNWNFPESNWTPRADNRHELSRLLSKTLSEDWRCNGESPEGPVREMLVNSYSGSAFAAEVNGHDLVQSLERFFRDQFADSFDS